ncbi:MAG: SMC-Scp complex subunit ScpB [Candidatus Eisenbacteria bacterium]
MESETKTNGSPSVKQVLEALLFASDAPLTLRELRQVMTDMEPAMIRAAAEELRADYDRDGRSFELREIENGYQVFTRPDYFAHVRRLRSEQRAMRLSRAAIETLAIVAYKQPVMRSEIELIRGVDAGGVLKTLLDRNLVTLKGRAEGVGRPLLYGTTDFFLNHFGLKGLDELPKIEELSEIMRSKEMDEIESEVEEMFGPRASLPPEAMAEEGGGDGGGEREAPGSIVPGPLSGAEPDEAEGETLEDVSGGDGRGEEPRDAVAAGDR